MTTTLAHGAPIVRPVIIQINVDITAVFWPLFALCWLGWIAVGRVGRFLGRLWEIGRAIVVVSGRRLRRWLRGSERRFAWQYSRWVYGPVLGVG